MVWKKMGALMALLVVASVGLGLLLGTAFFPRTIVEEKIVVEEVLVEVPYSVEVPVEVLVEVPVEVPVEVFVDNENLHEVLEFVYDANGDVEYVLFDLDDDELELIVDRILFVNEVKVLALEEVREDFRSLINKEYATNQERIFYEDVSRIRFPDVEHVTVDVLDFKYEDAYVTLVVDFRHEGDKYEAEFTVEFRDGEVDDVELEEIRVITTV